MKTLWLKTEEIYDGSQLTPLRNYLKHHILGNSCVAWAGPCNVANQFMKDGEDLIAGEEIRGGQMVHFIIEAFDVGLFAGVALQRLMADLVRSTLVEFKPELSSELVREGDDIYWAPERRKLSISIAIPTVNSVLIHFAVNVTREGTPVVTSSLSDWGVDPQIFALTAMEKLREEFVSIQQATYKVRT